MNARSRSRLRRWLPTLVVALKMIVGSAAMAAEWRAQWIGPADAASADRRNSWYCFRKTLAVGEVPRAFPVKIACDSKYWLWVNGELAVFEGGLKRGPTPTGTYFDVVDVAPHLKSGDNAIAILLWHFGKHGFSHNDSGKVGLVVDGASGNLVLRTDSTWRVLRYAAFEDANEPPPNFRLPEGNIRFDARKTLEDWQTKLNVDQWPAATEYGCPPAAPWGELVERSIPQWKDHGLHDYATTRETNSAHGRILIGQLPYNAQVHPWLRVTAPAGLKIEVKTDVTSVNGQKTIRAEYITRDGEQEFEFPGWMNGHEVRYFLPAGVIVQAVKYRETGYNAEFIGAFECDDVRLNKLWEKARRTLYVTMRDTYMDCPDRERAQWWGDAVNELGEAFYVFDATNGPRLARKGMLELMAFQRPDKTIYSPVPAGVPDDGTRKSRRDGSWALELPPQMLASVGYYGFWTYYLGTGDQETIRTVYPGVRDYLSLWELDSNGLAKHRPGDWDWTDWGTNIDVPVTDSAWIYLALRGAAEMAELLGKADDAAGYRQLMRRIEGGFNRTFWQGEFYRSPAYQGLTDDRANALAVVAGLALPEYYPAITRFLQTNAHASPYMEKYVIEALYLMRQPAAALARMKQRYGPMIDAPQSTLWERFARSGSAEPGSGTYNHAWSGGPLTMMHQYIAGIAPTAPGFQRFSVKPQLGPLRHVKTTVPTPYGNIELSVNGNSNHAFDLRLIVPDRTVADVELGAFKKTFRVGIHEFSVPRE